MLTFSQVYKISYSGKEGAIESEGTKGAVEVETQYKVWREVLKT